MTLHWTALFAAVALPLFAADTAHIQTDARVGGQAPLPGMSGGSLFFVPDTQPDAFRLYGPDGRLSIARLLPGRDSATLNDLAVGPNGEVAVSWQDLKLHHACGIDILNADGERVRAIPTGLFEARHLAFAQDGSVWVFGVEYTSRGYDGRHVENYATLRHFDANGTLAGQFLPRSLFKRGLEPAGDGNQTPSFFMGEDRFGIVAWNGNSSSDRQWIEVDFNGKVLGQYDLQWSEQNRVAMTSDGRVFAQNDKREKFLVLDHSDGQWNAVTIPSSSYESLWGADGNQLLLLSWKGGPLVIDRIDAPGAKEVAQK